MSALRHFKIGDRVRFTQAAVDRGERSNWRGVIASLERCEGNDFDIVRFAEADDDGLLGVVVNDEAGNLIFAGGAFLVELDDGPRPVVVYLDHDRGDEQLKDPQ